MNWERTFDFKGIETFNREGRRSIQELYESYGKLIDYGWSYKIMYEMQGIPVLCFTSPKKCDNSVYLMSGIHGDEPAGPNAIAEGIDLIGKFGQKFSIVLRPLNNPYGYTKDWRYFNERRDWHAGLSVGDSEYLLPDLNNRNKPGAFKPSSEYAYGLTQSILETMNEYPAVLSIDHHEDEALVEGGYIYSQGRFGIKDTVAQEIVRLLRDSGMPIQSDGLTRFGENVVSGIVSDVDDSSIDVLIASPRLFDGSPGPNVPSVFVIETPTVGFTLKERMASHKAIIESLDKLRDLAITTNRAQIFRA